MLQKIRICENCRTGQEAYLLEPRMDVCPHIDCWNDNTCPFYIPIKAEKKSFFEIFKLSKKNR